LECAHVHVLGQLGCRHGEAGGEHFGKNNHVGRVSNLPDFFFESSEVVLDIFPMEIGLYERDFQVLHSICSGFAEKAGECKESPFGGKSLKKVKTSFRVRWAATIRLRYAVKGNVCRGLLRLFAQGSGYPIVCIDLSL